jgi:nucleotide-binding universal stress UspA family protein
LVITAILVPLDGSAIAEQAIPYAQTLLPDGGDLVALRVVPEPEPPLTELLGALETTLDGAADPELAAARADLARAQTRLADPRLQWTIAAARGDPATEIVQVAAERGVGLIAMTTHGRDILGRVRFGSVADRVARAAAVPTFLVRPAPEGQPAHAADLRRVVVPLDGSERAEAALPVACDLAQQLHAPVRLLRVVDVAADRALLAFWESGLGSAAADQSILDALRDDAQQSLAAAAECVTRLGGTATWELQEGSPAAAIIDVVASGDLLVLTSHGRSGMLRWALGSVAEKLVREAPTPVVLVPASGRRTSVI